VYLLPLPNRSRHWGYQALERGPVPAQGTRDVLMPQETPNSSTLNKPPDCMRVFVVILARLYAPQALPCRQHDFPQGENGFGLQWPPHPRRRNDQLELAPPDAITKPLSVTEEVSVSGGC